MPARQGYRWNALIPRQLAQGSFLLDPVAPSTGVPGGLQGLGAAAFNLSSLIPRTFTSTPGGGRVETSATATSSSGGLPIVPIAIAGAAVVGFILWKRRKKGKR